MKARALPEFSFVVFLLAYASTTFNVSAQPLDEATSGDPSGQSVSESSATSAASDTRFEQRLAWNQTTLRDAYDKVGNKNAKWDDCARRALEGFARVRTLHSEESEAKSEMRRTIATNCAQAVATGCNDPMIAYLHALYPVGDEGTNAGVVAQAFRKAADDLNRSAYPYIRKFYGADRAARKLKLAAGTNTPPEVHHYRKLAVTNLTLALQDKSIPIGEVDAACESMRGTLSSNKKQMEQFYFQVEKTLFTNWPESSFPWLFKGQFYVTHAWAARGSGYAYTVTEEGWKHFAERLAVAEEALQRAWGMNPSDVRIPLAMLNVELGQGRGRQRMERWFSLAMSIDTNSYAACRAKLYYLEPKWHGSEADMLAFGRRCAESREWGGQVPLALAHAHDSLAKYVEKKKREDYWKQSHVWSDIRKAYNRFFELNPHAAPSFKQRYARHAYQCEQWEELNKLIPQLGDIDYEVFGGRAEFEKMVALAHENSSKVQGHEK